MILSNDARFEKGAVFSRRGFLRLPEHPEELWPLAVQAWPFAAFLVGVLHVTACGMRRWWAGRVKG